MKESINSLINGILKQENHLSYSSISAFKKSPLDFIKYKYNKSEPTPAMEFGSMVHKLLLEQNSFFDNKPECFVDPKTITGGKTYDKNTEAAVKKYSYCFNKTPGFSKYTQLRTDGKIDNAGIQGMGYQMDERGVMKYVPQKAKDVLGKAAAAGSKFLRKSIPGKKSNKQT
jgi:hypothetical protein